MMILGNETDIIGTCSFSLYTKRSPEYSYYEKTDNLNKIDLD